MDGPHLDDTLRKFFRDLTRAELIADGAVHAVGIVLAIAAGAALLTFAFDHAGWAEYAALIFYLSSLVTALSVSCAYNLWPPTPAKWVLRRADHAGIYLLIAGTYTPFLLQLDDPWLGPAMAVVVWGGALAGMTVKIFLPGRFDRLAIVFYLAIGWSGVMMVAPLGAVLPARTIWLIAAGGMVYSAGVIVFVWRGLRFQSAIWHGFVVAGAILHLAAVADLMVVARI